MRDNVRQRLKENSEKNYDKVRLEMLSMMSVEKRAWEKYPEVIKHHNLAQIDINEEKRKMYIEIATEQKAIYDTELAKLKKELLLATTFAVKAKEKEIVDKACKCFCDVCGCKECVKRNVVCTEYKEFRKAMEESAMTDEEYLNSKIEAYGKAHPNGNKEDLELLAEMRGYDKEDE